MKIIDNETRLVINETILDKLSTFDLTVGELYFAYARIFPKERNIWIGFAEDEIHRAQYFALLKTYLDRRYMFSDRHSNNLVEKINNATDIICEQIEKATCGNVDLGQSLLTGLEIEYSDVKNIFLNFIVLADLEAIQLRRNLMKMTKDSQTKFVMWLDHLDKTRTLAA